MAIRNRAPEFPAGLEWFNVDCPVRLADQDGRVVLIDFGVYSSVCCQHVLQDLQALGRKYRDGLVIISVHSPRFPAEMRRSHVLKTINRYHINHPVVHDPDMKLWNMYGIKGWPTQVLVDPEGKILGAISGGGKLPQLDQIVKYQLEKSSGQYPVGKLSCPDSRVPEPRGVLSFPGRIVAANDRLYVADSGHNRILVLSSRGHMLRQYGSEAAGFIDGNGTSAAFNNPQGMTLANDFLYVADEGNHAIRRVHILTDDVETIAGSGKIGQPIPGLCKTPLNAGLNSPCDVVFKDGKLYIAMSGSHQVWRLSLVANTLEVFSGSGMEGLLDGSATTAAFSQPSGLALLFNRLYAVDAGASAVRELDIETGAVRTIVGEGLFDLGDQDGAGTVARLQYPLDISADQMHRMLWVTDTYNNKIKRIGVNSEFVSSVAVDCRLDEPGGLVFHNDTLYIANTNAHEIMCLNPNNGHAEVLNVAEELVEI
ncbi:MAG: thioredoxin-like domain-containing protein [Gammaproteobacteria bacterium]|nr:thioredoxin-like domain-containing protein [Gammaproteobacteria bacterium]